MRQAPATYQHGASAYRNYGCRCDICREGNRLRIAEYVHRTGRHRPQAVYLAERYPEPPPHGTETRYTYHGCRCDECRAASREGRATRRRKQAAK